MRASWNKLSARLRQGGADLAVTASQLRARVEAIGTVRVVGSRVALFTDDRGEIELTVSHISRNALLSLAEDTVTSLHLSETGAGSLVAFAPPRVITVGEGLPVRVRPEQWIGLRDLPVGACLAESSSFPSLSNRVVIWGQDMLATVGASGSQALTWWLRNGSTLVLVPKHDGQRAWLELDRVVEGHRAANAPHQPNAVVKLGAGARFPLTEHDAEAAGPLAALQRMTPDTSGLMAAWSRYDELMREEVATAELERGQHDVEFSDARQQSSSWKVTARMDKSALVAWFRDEWDSGREIRVGQPVALVGSSDTEFTLRSGRVAGAGVVDLVLEHRSGSNQLPATGHLRVCTDRGQSKLQQRERAAMTRLSQGRAACANLAAILMDPSAATPPRLGPLPESLDSPLNDFQRHAIQMILGCVDVVAIQGPPGTGKTRVITEALRQIAALSRQKDTPLRVLVASKQNEAVHNVVERLADAGDMLVRLVQRRGSDELDKRRQARSLLAARKRAVSRLESQLAGRSPADNLRVLDEAEDRLRALQRTNMLDSRRALHSLRQFASAPPRLVGHNRSVEALRLADLLEAQLETSPVVVDTSAVGSPHTPGVSAPPSEPTEIQDWWSNSREAVRPEQRAEIDSLVTRLTGTASIANVARRARKVQKLQIELSDLIALVRKQQEPADKHPTEQKDLADRIDAWGVDVLQELLQMRVELERRPSAIAYRFLQTIRDSAAAWMEIVDRHGSTVAATCSKAADAAAVDDPPFDWVIIDEAGIASPFELLVAAVQGVRLVFIGDQWQLPPHVERYLVKKLEHDEPLPADITSESLFGELFDRLPLGCRERLSVQYRSHEAIGDWVSRLFYQRKGEGLTSWFGGSRAHLRAPKWGVCDDQPIAWVDVPGDGERRTETNQQEVAALIAAIRRFHEAHGEEHALDMAIICAYAQQGGLLKKQLGTKADLACYADNVRTIDSVQGREYDVVLFATSRTDGGAGFLASPQRVNVAISRARRQVLVFGSVKSMTSKRVRRTARHLYLLARELPRFASWRIEGESG